MNTSYREWYGVFFLLWRTQKTLGKGAKKCKKLDSLVLSRRELYRRKRGGEDVSAAIREISLALRPIRRELRCCQQIKERIPQIQEHIRLDLQAEEQARSEKTKTQKRRHELWK